MSHYKDPFKFAFLVHVARVGSGVVILLFLRSFYSFTSAASACCCSRDRSHTDKAMPLPNNVATMPRAMAVGMAKPAYSAIILEPINPSTSATAGSKYFRSVAA